MKSFSHSIFGLAILANGLVLSGCSDQDDPLLKPPTQRSYDTQQLLRGEQIYNQNCATCHGAGGTGARNWRTRGTDGRFLAPPLNGTAHTWHHPLGYLRKTIKDGGPKGQSNMPSWGSTLSDEQIDDVIAWFQSLWPAEVYKAWYDIGKR